MKTIRMLPPGSLRAQRRRGRIEGAAGMALIALLAGLAAIAMTPVELYRAATPTPNARAATPMRIGREPLPPCTDMGAKDCMAVADATVRTIPEPGTLVLVGAAAAGAMWMAKR